MARRALLAVAALLALDTGCPVPQGELRPEDFSKPAPWPGSSIVVGRNVVVRLDPNSGPGDYSAALGIDVFPPNAEVRGAWVHMVRHGQIYEGPAKIDRWEETQRYTVRGPDLLEPMARAESRGPDSTTVWIGPVCVHEACETLVVSDGDWPRDEPDQ
jgi:hypothetical protein